MGARLHAQGYRNSVGVGRLKFDSRRPRELEEPTARIGASPAGALPDIHGGPRTRSRPNLDGGWNEDLRSK